MKLKEKLAREGAYKAKMDAIGQISVEELSFINGFEKAREMGVEIIEYHSHQTPCTDNFILCDSACEGISQMKNLGEEEV